MSAAHFVLSASGSPTWLICGGSVEAQRGLPETNSAASIEGTAAHEIAYRVLNDGFDASKLIGGMYFSEGAEQGVYVGREMVDYIDDYVSYVQLIPQTIALFEVTVGFDNIIYGGFGQCDVLIYDAKTKTLHVIDLKYGQGIRVDAVGNTQGQIYAAGALNDYGYIWDIETIEIHIYQPRMANFPTWVITVDELESFIVYAAERAEYAMSKGAKRVASEKGCQWCKAKGDCKELQRYTERTIGALFENLDGLEAPDTLQSDEQVLIFKSSKLIISWLDAVTTSLRAKLLAGDSGHLGVKMVEGKGSREYKNELEAEWFLEDALGDEAFDRKMLSVAQAEKKIDKKLRAEFKEYFIRKPGAPTMVDESDPRPSIDDIEGMFEVVEVDEF